MSQLVLSDIKEKCQILLSKQGFAKIFEIAVRERKKKIINKYPLKFSSHFPDKINLSRVHLHLEILVVLQKEYFDSHID